MQEIPTFKARSKQLVFRSVPLLTCLLLVLVFLLFTLILICIQSADFFLKALSGGRPADVVRVLLVASREHGRLLALVAAQLDAAGGRASNSGKVLLRQFFHPRRAAW